MIYIGKFYMRWLLDKVTDLKKTFHCMCITPNMQADIQWWLQYLKVFKISMPILEFWPCLSFSFDAMWLWFVILTMPVSTHSIGGGLAICRWPPYKPPRMTILCNCDGLANPLVSDYQLQCIVRGIRRNQGDVQIHKAHLLQICLSGWCPNWTSTM